MRHSVGLTATLGLILSDLQCFISESPLRVDIPQCYVALHGHGLSLLLVINLLTDLEIELPYLTTRNIYGIVFILIASSNILISTLLIHVKKDASLINFK